MKLRTRKFIAMMINEKGKSRRIVLRCAEIMILLAYCATNFILQAQAVPLNLRTGKIELRSMTENDESTNLMTLSNCGVEDEPAIIGRSKRYVLVKNFFGSVQKWDHKSLTYKISKYASGLSETIVDTEIARAFAVWSNYTDLTFTPKKGKVDIDISFERGAHGDDYDFDGLVTTPDTVNMLAHAYYPGSDNMGVVHFDDDEIWTANTTGGKNLFIVAVHEFGHSLGLRHNNIESSVMRRSVAHYEPNFRLDNDDIAGIQALYGNPNVGDDKINNSSNESSWVNSFFKKLSTQINDIGRKLNLLKNVLTK